jgi:hypothetical protein
MPLYVTIPCTRCGHFAHMLWHEWLDCWPYVCTPCRAKERP